MNREQAQKQLSEYKCFFCGLPADRIAFFSKLYGNRSTKENPTFMCASCWESPQREELRISRGGMEGVFCYNFSDLGKMTDQQIGKITSRVRYEFNHMANRIWRKQVFQIHFLSKQPKSSV